MSFKPITGNPSAVSAHAEDMTEAATRMTEAAATLRQLGQSGSYQSQAIDKFEQQADQLAEVMTKASVRYQHAGKALADYWPVLQEVITDTGHAIAAAGQTDVGGAQSDYVSLKARSAGDFLNPLNDPEEDRRHKIELAQAEAHYHSQQVAMANAKQQYEEAVDRLEKAAGTAIQQIQEGERSSELNDTAWDNLKGFKEEFVDPFIQSIIAEVTQLLKKYLPEIILMLEIFNTLLSWVSTFLSMLACVFALLSLIPILTPFTGPIAASLATIATTLSLISFAISAIKFDLVLVQFAMGDATYGQLIGAGVGVATSLLMTTVGGGRGLSRVISDRAEKQGVEKYGAAVLGDVDSAATEILIDVTNGALEDSLNAKWDSAPDFWESAGEFLSEPSNQFIEDRSTTDVAPMTTDLSRVDVDGILGRAFSAESARDRGLTLTVGTVQGLG